MFKKSILLATIIMSVFSNSASAEFIQTDWKTTNDKLATLQTSTGLEWLDLTYTNNWSINQAYTEMSTSLQGWRLATQHEVTSLWSEILGVSLGTVRTSVGITNKPALGYLGTVFAFNYLYTSGKTIDDNGNVVDFGSMIQAGSGAYYHLWNGGFNKDSRSTVQGIYLVSDGGTTLSSINNPNLNINNPNAPINTADVFAPAGMAATSLFMLLMGARRNRF